VYAIPRPDIVTTPAASVLPHDDLKMKNFIDAWIELKQKELPSEISTITGFLEDR
jgi:hypothetical protein